jgi:hypothetical protein
MLPQHACSGTNSRSGAAAAAAAAAAVPPPSPCARELNTGPTSCATAPTPARPSARNVATSAYAWRAQASLSQPPPPPPLLHPARSVGRQKALMAASCTGSPRLTALLARCTRALWPDPSTRMGSHPCLRRAATSSASPSPALWAPSMQSGCWTLPSLDVGSAAAALETAAAAADAAAAVLRRLMPLVC